MVDVAEKKRVAWYERFSVIQMMGLAGWRFSSRAKVWFYPQEKITGVKRESKSTRRHTIGSGGDDVLDRVVKLETMMEELMIENKRLREQQSKK
jgi:hypothetical protein